MEYPRAILLSAIASLVFVVLMQGCATSGPMIGGSSSDRQLTAIVVSPASGTAPSAGGQVQFVATGIYNTAPYTVTLLVASWGVQSYPQAIASTDQTGLATCKQGSSGTTTIEAWVQESGPVCNVIDSAGRPACNNIWSSAQLICP
jgi:hypothetical protein